MDDDNPAHDPADDVTVVELSASDTYPLRLSVLRVDTPTKVVAFAEDDMPGTVHLGVRVGDEIVAISTWIPRPFNDEPAVQLRGMATAPHLRGRGVGGILVESGCVRSATVAPLVWARARDTAIDFYLRHGFAVAGDGFVDESTGKPHHVIVRRVA
jgi:predicted GNAT family N-acyltransferase